MTVLSRRGLSTRAPSNHEVASSTVQIDSLADCTKERLGSGIGSILLHSRYTCQGDVTTYRSNASIDTVHAYLVRTKSDQGAKSFMSGKNSRVFSAAPSCP